MKTTTAVVVSAVLAGSAPARVFAKSSTFDVPTECGSAADFRRELTRLAGSDAARAEPTLVRIIRASSGAYHLTLVLANETRALEHTDCRVLLRSAAVIAAASLKIEAATPPAPEPSAPASNASARTVPPPRLKPSASNLGAGVSVMTSSSVRADHGPALHGSVALGEGIADGVTPGVGGALEARGALLAGHFGAALGLRYFPSKLAEVEGRAADIWGLGLRPAFVFVPSALLEVSLGLDVDRLSGRGSNLAKPERDSAWALAPSLEFALVPVKAKHFFLEIAAEGRLALLRPSFVVTGFQALYRVPSLGTVLVLREAWQFP